MITTGIWGVVTLRQLARIIGRSTSAPAESSGSAEAASVRADVATQANDSPRGEPGRKRQFKLKVKLSLGQFLTVTVVIAVLVPAVLAGVYAFQAQYRKALKDTWAILFLESERIGTKVSANLAVMGIEASAGVKSSFSVPDFIYSVEDGKKTKPLYARGQIKTFTASSIGVRDLKFKASQNVVVSGGKTYLVRIPDRRDLKSFVQDVLPDESYLIGWRIDFRKLMPNLGAPSERQPIVYVINQGGQLIYANDPKMTALNLIARPLLQNFKETNLATAELEFSDPLGIGYYGFYQEIPSTNLVMFVETSKTQALYEITDFAKRYALVMAGIMAAVIMMLQWPLRRVTRPIKELLWLSKEISSGNFKVKTSSKGFGEVDTLSKSFTLMADNLVRRDASIRSLMLEQQEKLRMARELEVAKTVQDNLLPRAPLTEESGLSLAAMYIPAAQVAGDWYTYDYNAESGETIIVVADVSGHDMAASMFAAVIAGLFFEIRESNPARFPMEDFAARVGRRIRGFAQEKWHVTMQIVRYERGGNTVEITNCGHTFPLIVNSPESGQESTVIRLPSGPLGLGESYPGITKKVVLPAGQTLVLYTDGVTETRNTSGKPYGQKRLLKFGTKNASLSPEQLIRAIHRDCITFRQHNKNEDDFCLLALRAKVGDA